MSILIKGMEMPTDRPQLLWVYPNGEVLIVQSDVDPWKELHAVPVPPHGGLVDLKAPFKAQYLDEMTEEWEEKMVTVEDVLYLCMVDEMPSITIPADPAEGGE